MIFNICHYTPLDERKIQFIKQATNLQSDITLNFVHDHDREELTQQQRDKFMKISDAEISLFLKHIHCYNTILSSGEPYGVVMEDDCVFHDDFDEHMCIINENMPVDADIMYCGVFPFYKQKPVPVPKQMIDGRLFYDMTDVQVFPWTGNNKGTDFYIINNNTCDKLIQEFDDRSPVTQPIDHWLGTTCINRFKTYWYNTEFTTHGSWGDGEGVNACFNNSMEQFRNL